MAHLHVNFCLTKIVNVLRKLQFETSLLNHDNPRSQRLISEVTVSRSAPSAQRFQRQESSIKEDIPKDSRKSNYGNQRPKIDQRSSRYRHFARADCKSEGSTQDRFKV